MRWKQFEDSFTLLKECWKLLHIAVIYICIQKVSDGKSKRFAISAASGSNRDFTCWDLQSKTGAAEIGKRRGPNIGLTCRHRCFADWTNRFRTMLEKWRSDACVWTWFPYSQAFHLVPCSKAPRRQITRESLFWFPNQPKRKPRYARWFQKACLRKVDATLVITNQNFQLNIGGKETTDITVGQFKAEITGGRNACGSTTQWERPNRDGLLSDCERSVSRCSSYVSTRTSVLSVSYIEVGNIWNVIPE